MVHFVKRLGKVKVNDIVVIAIQKTLDNVVNKIEEHLRPVAPRELLSCYLKDYLRSQKKCILKCSNNIEIEPGT